MAPDAAAVLDALDGRRFTTTVTASDEAVRDHLVHGAPVLPGVFHLDLLLRMVQAAGGDPAEVELRRCLFVAPVVAHDDVDRKLEIVAGPRTAGGGLPVEVRSVPLVGETPASEGWETNFKAEVRAADPWEEERVDADAVRARAAVVGDADLLYGFARQLQIQHGPFMKVEGEVCGDREVALADVRLSPQARAHLDHFWVHPVFLDFSVLVPFLQFEEHQRAAVATPYIPIFVESFRACAPLPAEALVHVPALRQRRLDPDTETVTAHIRCCDRDGRVLVRLTGYRAKRVRSAEHIRDRLRRPGALRPGTPAASGTQASTPSAPGAVPAGASSPAPASPEGLDVLVARLVAGALDRDEAGVARDTPFYDLGLRSVDLLSIAGALEQELGCELYPTLLFEYPTVTALAQHLGDEGHGVAAVPPPEPAPSPTTTAPAEAGRRTEVPAPVRAVHAGGRPQDAVDMPIAVVGMAGRYGGARDVHAFWNLVRAGIDCVGEVPAERWDHERYFDPRPGTPGRTNSRWGSFVEGVDEFDAGFFGLDPEQAALMDPHDRLFLQTAWSALEDAGHTPANLREAAGGAVGVYAGVMWNDYQLHALDTLSGPRPQVVTTTLSYIPNRVSAFLDLRGPSMAVDTACSSSLVAVHLACQSIRQGESRAALAGGVNLALHPYKYVRSAELGLLSPTGRCRPFAKDADGYVPGEGVGVLLLRPLDDALADGDHVYGVIRSSALHHSGRGGGFSVPSPEAQARVVGEALARAGVSPRAIGYVEAHGAATPLGDQIEVAALSRAFRERTGDHGSCALGSVKSNIGHTEAAAGVAALTKALLCLRHRTLVPSLHLDEPNPAIDFEGSPFRLQRDCEPWPAAPDGGADAPLRAGVSAFGFGGAGVHLVVEAAPAIAAPPTVPGEGGAWVVPLSARDDDRLRERVAKLRHALEGTPELRLRDVARTLQSGREPMAARVAFVVADMEELAGALEAYLDDRSGPGLRFTGTASPGAEGTDSRAAAEVARAWAHGGPGGWEATPLPPSVRVPLPCYPFARERHWLSHPAEAPARSAGRVRCYEPVWVSEAAPAAAAPGGTLLLFDSGDERARALRERGHELLHVRPARAFARRSGGGYDLPPGDLDAWRQVLVDLRADGSPLGGVLHLWRFGTSAAGEHGEDAEAVADALLALCKGLLVGLTRQVSVVHAFTGPAVQPAHAAVGGLARSVRLEQPKLALKTVQVGEPLASADALCRLLLSELSTPGDLEVRHDGQGRRVLRFAAATPGEPDWRLARPGGVYVISGGAGGLGLHVARHLAATEGVALVLFGRSRTEAAQQRAVEELRASGAEATYVEADVTVRGDVDRVVAAAARLGALTGVIHAAGVAEDALLIGKTRESARRVLGPKIRGTHHLDAATQQAPLDYLLLFSSVASVLGSEGACDYALANRYLDAFAAWREELRARGRRTGRTLAINWPLWRDGGMRIHPETEQEVLARAGLEPLETAAGLRTLEAAPSYGGTQLVVACGDPVRFERRMGLCAAPPQRQPPGAAAPAACDEPDAATTGRSLPELRDYLEALVAELLGDPAGPARGGSFLERGLSSQDLVRMSWRLHEDLGVAVDPPVFFDHPDVERLAAHLAEQPAPGPAPASGARHQPGERRHEGGVGSGGREPGHDIAIIGAAGRFPQASGLEEFWEALAAGRDLIGPVPAHRWDHRALLDGRHPLGHSDCAAGAFLDDIASFDAGFFGVLPPEADVMDPQVRVLLEVCYAAAEDAAVLPGLRGSATGMFVGQCFRDYDGEMIARGRPVSAYDATGIAVAMSSNRPSFFFDLSGPSLTLDTACSSSLYALYLAVSALRRGECEMTFAAGTNLITSPRHYLQMAAIGALSPTGRCHAFDARADGYVPGEAVAAVLLKPLERALADGDPIRAVIRGVAANHGGHASSLTAPSPARQAALLRQAWEDAGVDPVTITYLEAHGTGTRLGDPIEVEGAKAAFAPATDRRRFCALGTAKAHLGHTEAAAGITGVVKAMLQLQHTTVPAMPGLVELNPYCRLDEGPLYVPRSTSPWVTEGGVPRRAGVSSFGFGGAGAHVLLEEAPARHPGEHDHGPWVFPLSARSADRLRESAMRHRAIVAAGDGPALAYVAATLQRGRDVFPERVAIVAADRQDLLEGLDAFLAVGRSATVHGPRRAHHPELVEEALRWCRADVDALEGAGRARAALRVPLPTYPFARERYWFEEGQQQPPAAAAAEPGVAGTPPAGTAAADAPTTVADGDDPLLAHLRDVLAEFLRRTPEEFDADTPFEQFGLDSRGAIAVSARLEGTFGPLPKVLLYEATTLRALAAYLRDHHPDPCASLAAASQLPPAPPASAAPSPEASTTRAPEHELVAIVGIAGLLPGAPDVRALWRRLRDGDDLTREIPPERFDWRAIYGDPRRDGRRTNSRWGGFIEAVDCFDAEFFSISPLEAELMDPQQRLLLQTVWHCLGDAGHAPRSLRGSRTGVFVGAGSHDYFHHLLRNGRAFDAYAITGNAHAVLANRVSFELDLRGPSETIDTACSGSLTALHHAVRAMEAGDCEAAIVGGVHLALTEDLFVAFGQMGVLSPDGRCRAFDRHANGFVRGEGVVAVYCKPLSRARADRDTVYAVVRGTAVGHGGAVSSLTVPNPAAQAEWITAAYARAGVDPRTVTYVEAHGTGTVVGDPIEIHGLKKAFGAAADGTDRPWCGVGSIKSNIGHLEAAAGLAGVAKVLLSLRHGTLPASAGFQEANPLLELEGSPLRIVGETQPWPRLRDGSGAELPRRAGVSSLGFGGAGVHVLLEEDLGAPAPAERAPSTGRGQVAGGAEAGPAPVVLSARDPDRLRAYARALAEHLDAVRAEEEPPVTLADVAYTLGVGREALPHRLAVPAASLDELTAALHAYADGSPGATVITGQAGPTPGAAPAETGDVAGWARYWVQGGAVDWAGLPPQGSRPRRVPLPSCPFAPVRHWAGTEPTAAADGGLWPAGAVADVGSPVERAAPSWSALLEGLRQGDQSLDEVDAELAGDGRDPR